MVLFYNAEGESKDFSPGDTTRFEEGFTFDSDPTAETTPQPQAPHHFKIHKYG